MMKSAKKEKEKKSSLGYGYRTYPLLIHSTQKIDSNCGIYIIVRMEYLHTIQ